MSDKEDYLTSYRVFFENFAATVNPEDQLPVNIAGYTITEAELPGEVLYWTTQYLAEKQCPLTLMTPLLRIILDEVRIASKKQPNEFGYKSDEGVYIALRLMQAVTARANDVCLRYLDNSRLDSLPPPPPPELRELQTVSIATKNSRRVMEDRHVEIGNLEALFGIETTEPTSFYAVYDGHAGSAAATYSAAHLHQYLVESPHFATDLKRAMRDAYLRTDTDFVRKSNQECACGGSTAVCIAVRGRKLLAAWAGDSLALLAKRLRLMQLVQPHKPSRQDEQDRIEQSGGTVIFWGTWRVNGQLAVSRAIGDAQYKPYVIAKPEIATVDLDGDEDFVVVASDGLFDFVSEDDVALAVYRQVATNPDDLKAVTKRLVVQAKRQGSTDNISIIVVFLKDPRSIAADCPPLPLMDLGLDNALSSAPPPFAMEAECKRLEAAGGESACAGADADNGVDNSDSDSEDLGPETAVDVDADVDDLDAERREAAPVSSPAPPTPPAHTVGESHIDGGLVDNVAESGEESEDEWNYFKGEGEPQQDETEERPRSETPCQDNSAWESSSVDMNSSPLNPDAPVFVPGVAAGDVLLAESPRKPLPMDDIELPDVAQFRTEAVVRPAELLDLDNCDQLNGHHNISMEGVKEHFNGNDKCDLNSLGFGFNVGIEPEKVTDTALIQDFERIQKDTTDFCNIQVFQAHTETNPFAAEDNDELLERLKNKERDPMSMSFYQEKDDDTCERLAPAVDLNAVQTLPDSDDDETPTRPNTDKENVDPTRPEPDNDLANPFALPTTDNHYPDTNNMNHYQNFEFDTTNAQGVAQTDTPESHKLLFEQIPEIPDGKSSELGFANDDTPDPESEEVRAITPQEETSSQDVEMESKNEDSPGDESQEFAVDLKEQNDLIQPSEPERLVSPEHGEDKENEIVHELENLAISADKAPASPGPEFDRSASPDYGASTVADVHHAGDAAEPLGTVDDLLQTGVAETDLLELGTPQTQPESEPLAAVAASPLPADRLTPLLSESPLPAQSPLPTAPPAQSPLPSQSPAPADPSAASPLPAEVPLPRDSPAPAEPLLRPETVSPLAASPLPTEEAPAAASPALDVFSRLSPAPAAAAPTPEPSGPAPDIVPEEPARPDADLLGPVESRAQEICVPVTNEIQHEDSSAATPPPTPAVQPALLAAPLSDAASPGPAAAAAAGAAVAAVAAAGVAAAASVAKPKSATPAKKSPTAASKTTPRPAPKAPTTRTPASAPRKPASTPATPAARATPAAKTTPARTPASAARPAGTPASAPRAASARTTPVRPAAPAAPAAKPAPRTTAAPKAAPAAPKPAAPRPATAAAPRAPISARSATAAAPRVPISARAATAPRTATAPAPKPAPSRPATAPARPPAARPASRPAPTAAAARPKPIEKKPLPNGDVKPLSAKPAPRPAAARPAPRPTPRAAPATGAAPAAAAPKSAAAPRAAPRRPAPDKLTKDLANRRLTAAPPRTAANKAPAAAPNKNGPIKSVPKKRAPSAESQPQSQPALTNGAGDAKAPPSPPPADAALPDVIA